MDLYAFSKIDDYASLLKDNGIDICRLRGIRCMGDEEPQDEDSTKRYISQKSLDIVRDIARTTGNIRRLIPVGWSYYTKTDKRVYKWTKDGFIHWEHIHGRRRKSIKYLIKKAKRNVKTFDELFNKYVGRADVFMVHTRTGSDSWAHCDYTGEPWCLGQVDDLWDETYQYVFVKVNVEE